MTVSGQPGWNKTARVGILGFAAICRSQYCGESGRGTARDRAEIQHPTSKQQRKCLTGVNLAGWVELAATGKQWPDVAGKAVAGSNPR